MTDTDLAAIEARAAAAEGVQWIVDKVGLYVWLANDDGKIDSPVFDTNLEEDAAQKGAVLRTRGWGRLVYRGEEEAVKQQCANATFAAHARADVPALLAEVRRLRALLDPKDAHPIGLLRRNLDGKPVDFMMGNYGMITVGYFDELCRRMLASIRDIRAASEEKKS